MSMTLNELANKYGSDKGDSHHEAHNYAVLFEELLKEFPPDLKLLEIGIFDHRFPGASPRMWREFLPHAKLFGLDINPLALKLEQETGMKIFLANQSDALEQEKVMKKIGSVDFVVDDGSHILSHICNSLTVIWPYLSSEGYYIIEDLHAPHAQPREYIERLVKDELLGFPDQISQLRWERDRKLLIIKKR